jgi:hypothetical protein
MTAVHALSKPDTVLLLDFAAGNDEIDYSQERTNLTNSSPELVEASSARTAISTYREIAMVLQVTNTDTGYLLDHGDNLGVYSYRVRIAVAGTVRFQEGGSVLASVTIPDLAAGERNILFHWSQFNDGGNVRSEFLVYNFTSATFSTASGTHTLTAPDPTDTFTVNGTADGEVGFSGGLADWVYLRIGKRHHSYAEAREDWIANTSPPAMTQTRRIPALVPDRSTLTDLGCDGSFAGPPHLWAGHAFESADRRLVGALINARVQNPVTITTSYAEGITAWWRLAPESTTLRMNTAYLWRCKVPPKVSKGYVRVWVRGNNTTATASVAELRLRVYSMSGLPVVGEPPEVLKFHRTAQVTHQVDDGTSLGAGALKTPGALDLAVDDSGWTWIACAVEVDTVHAQAANTEHFIHMLTLDPYHEPVDGGALGVEDP